MNSKITKRTGTRRRVFKNLDDISQFEEELVKKDLATIGETFVEMPVADSKYRLDSHYYDPKTKMFTRIDSTDPEQVEYVTKKGMIPGLKQQEIELKNIPHKLANDPKSSYLMEANPIIFEAKGKTPPSVPYLRVFVESSLGEENAVHFVHNKTRSSKN